MKFYYLLINLFSSLIPFIFSFHSRIKFNKYFFSFLQSNAPVSLLFILWDILFTYNNVWSFNPKYLIGYSIINLPIEEVIFFICIPFACVFTVYCIEIKFEIKWPKVIERFIVSLLCFLFLLFGLYAHAHIYTLITCVSTSLILFVLYFGFKMPKLSSFLSIYPLLLLPFFIVNGILTGSLIEEPIVIYNNYENLGYRILNIPIEDFIYGFELLLLNKFLFDCIKTKAVKTI